MPAAVYRGEHTVVVEDVPIPNIGAGQVLLEVSHCGICGSDLHLMMEDWGQPGMRGGHEFSGTVVAVGSDVAGWTAGDRAVGGPAGGCGRCLQCQAGRTNLCLDRQAGSLGSGPAGYARYAAVDAGALFRLPGSLSLRTAALTEPVAVAVRGIRRAGAAAGDRVLVTGAGPIGLLTVAVLRSLGVTDITVSEPGERRRALAGRIGAALVVEPDGLPRPAGAAELVDRPFQVAIDCSGRADAMETALANLARAGTLVLSGTGLRRPRFNPNRIILHELTVTGTVEYTPDDYRTAIDLLDSGRLPTNELIEADDVPLPRLQRAMERLVAGELAGKVLVVPGA
jgi:(R,R)-butanediol dehydrogenase/meso-butanediol dehydrogenase/diacetyl reductase